MADYTRFARLLWACLSIAVAVISTTSYMYDATWVGGKPKLNGTDATLINMSTTAFVDLHGDDTVKFTFSTFRRCNHWILDRSDSGYRYTIGEKCAGYKSFSGDNGIPSSAWKACTVIGGISCSFLDLLVPLAFGAFLTPLPKAWAAICGIVQGTAGKINSTGIKS
jgi:hypothetical protein